MWIIHIWLTSDPLNKASITANQCIPTCHYLASKFNSGKDITLRPPWGYCNHRDKRHVPCEECLGQTDAGAWPLITVSGSLAWWQRNRKSWCTQKTHAALKYLHRLHLWIVATTSKTSGSWCALSWPLWMMNQCTEVSLSQTWKCWLAEQD